MDRQNAEAEVTIGDVALVLDMAEARSGPRDKPARESWDEMIARIRSAIARNRSTISARKDRESRVV